MSRSASPYLAAHTLSCELPDGRALFHALTFGLADERVGLVGPNGAGKSTLLQLLAGTRTPTSGTVHRRGRVAYMPQQQRLVDAITVADALGVSATLDAITRAERGEATAADLALIGDAWNTPERVRITLADVGLAHLTPERTVATLSGGERTRLALGAHLLDAPQVLLLDEPTNDLDADSRAALYALIDRWRYGLLVASHDRTLLDRMDRIVELSGGTARSYGGNYTRYREQVDTERAAAQREQDSAAAALERTKRQLRAVAERKAQTDARGRRERSTGSQPSLVLNAARERSEATTGRLAERAERLVDVARERVSAASARLEEQLPLRITLPASGLAAGTTVFSLTDVDVGHSPDAPLLTGVSFDVVGPERIALTGANGSGKSTLLRALAGDLEPRGGRLYRGVPAGRIAWMDQHIDRSVGSRDANATVLDAYLAHHPRGTPASARAVLARFRFRGDTVSRSLASLSGGERMRVALACLTGGDDPPQCLLLDEPTNHLDLDSVGLLEAALRDWDGAIIAVSHDAAFLTAIGVTRQLPVSRWHAAEHRRR